MDDGLPYLSEKYVAAQSIFDQGDYILARDEYGDEMRRTSQTSRRNWVDSICYHAKVGECHYQMGEIANAMACFEIALQDYLTNYDCFQWMHFDTVESVQYVRKNVAPWGDAASSQGQMAIVPRLANMDYMLPEVNADSPKRGFQPAPDGESRPMNPTELAACLALALSRRAEMLGPLGRYDALNEKLVQQLRERPFPEGHWSAVWGDILLALALATAGNDTEAKTLLEQNLAFPNAAEHPLSGFAMMELGKISLRLGDLPAASLHFYEASLSAWRYENTFILGESFRHMAMIPKMAVSNPPQFLAKAVPWAEKERLRGLLVLLKTLSAEEAVFKKDWRSAEKIVREARTLAKQHDIEYGRLVGSWDYITAINEYNANNLAAGDRALDLAMERMRRGSPWSYQLKRVKELFDSGKISTSGEIAPRLAMELYARLLREPTDSDWQMNTSETLAVSNSPLEDVYEQWFALAIAQRDYQKAFEIAEQTRRHRFQSTLNLGNRLISLRYLLEAPNHLLTREQLMQRARLLSENDELKKVSDDMQRVCRQIASQPLLTTDSSAQRRLDASYKELGTLAERQEMILHRMALEGIAAPNFFPPILSFDEFCRRQPEGTLTLMYFETMGEFYGFLISRDKSEIWRIENPQQLKSGVANYLALLGQNGAASMMEIDELGKGTWTKAGQTLFLDLLGGGRTLDFTELVVVPDGYLWYLPFETLSVDVGEKRRPLVALAGRTVRYAPTAALGLPIARAAQSDSETLVFVGKMSDAKEISTVRNAYERMSRQVNGTKSMTPSQITRSPAMFGKFIPQLVVWDDIAPPKYDHDWAPLSGTKELPGTQMTSWLQLPWGGPKLVVLPGYHTAAEDALKNGGDGHELFLPLTALQACGTETVIISRWQPGGRSGFDQVIEYLKTAQDKQYTAAQAWQRSSLQTASSKLVAREEPRINGTVAQKAALDARANHPFFWGGYLFCDRGQNVSSAEGSAPPRMVPEIIVGPETAESKTSAESITPVTEAAAVTEMEPDESK